MTEEVKTPEYQGPERRKRDPVDLFPPFAVRYIMIVVTVLLGIGVYGAYQQNDDLHKSAIKNCETSNVIRVVIRHAFDAVINGQIEGIQSEIQLSNSIPPKFFPQIPPKQYQRLLKQGTDERRQTIDTLQRAADLVDATLQPADCEAIF